MPYLHSLDCPKCGHETYICTSDEDGFAHGAQFECHCPTCTAHIAFSSHIVQILDDDQCPGGRVPEGSTIGKLFRSKKAV